VKGSKSPPKKTGRGGPTGVSKTKTGTVGKSLLSRKRAKVYTIVAQGKGTLRTEISKKKKGGLLSRGTGSGWGEGGTVVKKKRRGRIRGEERLFLVTEGEGQVTDVKRRGEKRPGREKQMSVV